MDLDKSLLSTKPMISLRSHEDDASIVRFLSEFSPSGDIVVLYSIGDTWHLNQAMCHSTQFTAAQVLSHLEQAMNVEAGIPFKILAWGRKAEITVTDWGHAHLYVGDKLIATAMIDSNTSTFSDFDIIDKLQQCEANIVKHLYAALDRNRDWVDHKTTHLIQQIVRMFKSMDKEHRSILVDKISLPISSVNELESWLKESCDQTSLLRVFGKIQAYQLSVNRSQVTLRDPNKLTRVFVTETHGREIARMEFDMLVYSCSPVVFIEQVWPISALTSGFMVGFLKEAVLRSGTEKAFHNRFKFIGFDNYMSVIDEAIKTLLYEKTRN